MRKAAATTLALLACSVPSAICFKAGFSSRSTLIPSIQSLLHTSTSSDFPGPLSNLVDKDVFVSAVATLKAELAKQGQQEGNSDRLAKPDEAENFYAIGRITVSLDVSTGNPGMDLAESTGGLVLVSAVAGKALDAGIQTGDTIVAVAVANAYQETCAYALEDTARILMGAMRHAVENGTPKIELELNRLIKMRYA